MLENWIFDARASWRSLRRDPAFALTVIVTLALGLGAATAMFTVVDSVLLEPLPLRDPERLVWMWSTQPEKGAATIKSSEADVVDWRQRQTRFAGIVTGHNRALTLTGEQETAKLSAVVTTHDFFQVLGTRAELGRTFEADDLEQRTVLLSHRFWRQGFAADESVLGRELILDGETHRVLGVLPKDFLLPRADVDVYLTRRLVTDRRRSFRGFFTLGRLADGVSLAAAQEEMHAVATDLAEEHPESNQGWDVTLVPLRDHLVQDARPALWVLLGAVSLLLVIACVNVAGLLLARAEGRAREAAMCRALGADRWRLAGRLLIENLLLTSAAAVVGIGVAAAALPPLLAVEPGGLPRHTEIAVDGGALAFAWLASLLTALLFSSAPLWTDRRNLAATLRGATGASSRGRWRGGLVTGQIALAVVLILTAGLLHRSLTALYAEDPGFAPENLAVMRLFTRPGEMQRTAKIEFFSQLESALAAVPGVQRVGGATTIPFSGIGIDLASPFSLTKPDPRALAKAPRTTVRAVTPGFLEALGVSLDRGRWIEDRDRPDSLPVALVNRSLAALAWPGEDPIGKTLRVRHGDWRERRVVGVVGDLRQDGPAALPGPELYLPHAQHEFYSGLTYVLRTEGDPAPLLETLRRTVLQFDPNQPPHSLTTMEALRADVVARDRFAAFLAAVFATLAVTLAAVGLYGVISWTVTQRRRELGIRRALGARRRQLFSSVLGRALGLAGLGLLAGHLAAGLLGRWLESLLFGVSRHDPLVLAAGTLLLLSVALLASWLPARRAMAVHPSETLRHE